MGVSQEKRDGTLALCVAQGRFDLPFLERLAEAGVAPEAVDYVMCTHLHVDHCGGNTRLVDDRRAPSFPNARYVFSKSGI